MRLSTAAFTAALLVTTSLVFTPKASYAHGIEEAACTKTDAPSGWSESLCDPDWDNDMTIAHVNADMLSEPDHDLEANTVATKEEHANMFCRVNMNPSRTFEPTATTDASPVDYGPYNVLTEWRNHYAPVLLNCQNTGQSITTIDTYKWETDVLTRPMGVYSGVDYKGLKGHVEKTLQALDDMGDFRTEDSDFTDDYEETSWSHGIRAVGSRATAFISVNPNSFDAEQEFGDFIMAWDKRKQFFPDCIAADVEQVILRYESHGSVNPGTYTGDPDCAITFSGGVINSPAKLNRFLYTVMQLDEEGEKDYPRGTESNPDNDDCLIGSWNPRSPGKAFEDNGDTINGIPGWHHKGCKTGAFAMNMPVSSGLKTGAVEMDEYYFKVAFDYKVYWPGYNNYSVTGRVDPTVGAPPDFSKIMEYIGEYGENWTHSGARRDFYLKLDQTDASAAGNQTIFYPLAANFPSYPGPGTDEFDRNPAISNFQTRGNQSFDINLQVFHEDFFCFEWDAVNNANTYPENHPETCVNGEAYSVQQMITNDYQKSTFSALGGGAGKLDFGTSRPKIRLGWRDIYSNSQIETRLEKLIKGEWFGIDITRAQLDNWITNMGTQVYDNCVALPSNQDEYKARFKPKSEGGDWNKVRPNPNASGDAKPPAGTSTDIERWDFELRQACQFSVDSVNDLELKKVAVQGDNKGLHKGAIAFKNLRVLREPQP